MATTTKLDMDNLDEATSSEVLSELAKRTTTLHEAIHDLAREQVLVKYTVVRLGNKMHEDVHTLVSLVAHIKKRLGEGFVEVMP